MVNEKAAVFDVDGVLLDFDSGFIKMAEKICQRKLERLSNSFDLDKRYGLTEEEFAQTWDAMCQTGFADLDPFPGVVEAFGSMKEAGYSIHIVTGIPEELADMRLENLRKHGMHVDSIDCVGHGRAKKHEKIAQYKPIMFVDDRLEHLHDAHFVPYRVWIDLGDDQHGHTNDGIHMSVKSLDQWVSHWHCTNKRKMGRSLK